MMLPEWAQQVARGGDDPICVHTRDAVVDVTDVRDVVGAYRLLMEHGHGGQVYNVGSGVPRRSGDLLAMLLEIAGATDRPVEEIRPGRKQDPIAEIGRLVECTGWRARVSMEQTIFDTLQYWRRVAESS
jgi:GDP-4-dehydro-6-deoxy-D-mannose reductase